ncbi:MAG: Scr1 family TA system antitoxin-like transcriptional regulator, partial [Mycobacteriales bacterium]
VLLRPVGGRGVLRRQLIALREGLDEQFSDVNFRITLLSTPARGAIGGAFTILRFTEATDKDVVYLEGREDAAYLETDGDVARYDEKFRSLERDSLTRDESVKRLSEEIDRLEESGEQDGLH